MPRGLLTGEETKNVRDIADHCGRQCPERFLFQKSFKEIYRKRIHLRKLCQ